MQLRPGSQVGPYTVTREIARGGQGAVLEARGPRGQVVALKLLLDDDEEASARFLREAETLSRLDHPNLIKVLDQGQTPGGVAYLALEFVHGQSLSDWVRSGGPPPLDEALRVMGDAAEALHYCHEQGLVHRDLKPQNILLEAETGRVVIVDFGLVRRSKLALAWSTQDRASLTQEGSVLGTPAYMPPEQISPEFGGVDRRSDVYGLGATLYFLLTGEAPFKAPGGVLQLLTRVVSDPPRDPRALRPDLPEQLARVCIRALAKDPSERPTTALELGTLLLSPAGRQPSAPLTWGLVLGGLCLTGLSLGAALFARAPTPAPGPVQASPNFSTPTSLEPLREETLARVKQLLGEEDEAKHQEAERLLSDLVERGSPRAAFALGMRRLDQSRPEEARQLLQQAAKGGSSRAMVNLGLLYEKGLGARRPDAAQAEACYRQAAEHGEPLGMTHLAKILLSSDKREPEAIGWLERAAAQGEPSALALLAHCTQTGRGLPKDLPRAVAYYESAADKGHLHSTVWLAHFYEAGGPGFPQDLARSAQLFRRAALGGEVRAYFPYGEALLLGKGVPSNPPEALEWYLRAAESNHPAALGRIGLLYLRGATGVEQQPERGVQFLERAAAAGRPEAMFELGRALCEGRGTERSPLQGAAWVRRAAEAGEPNAMLLYYRILVRGAGVPRDPALALEWLERAAEGGQVQAMAFWGVELRKRKEFGRAVSWLTRAANKGEPNASYNLASCYTRGEGVPKDLALAKSWFRKVVEAAPDSPLGREAAKALEVLERSRGKTKGKQKLIWQGTTPKKRP